jgi:hypothetical protein
LSDKRMADRAAALVFAARKFRAMVHHFSKEMHER